MTDQERHKLVDQLLEHYASHVPESMELRVQVAYNPDILEFWITHYAAPGVVYGGTFRISYEALEDGLDARSGIEALLERARSGALPARPAGEAAKLLFLCTSVDGLRTLA